MPTKQLSADMFRLRSIWYAMKHRCHSPQYKNYQHYGALGVTVCEEWRNSLEAFATWALSSGYSPELTLDRRQGAMTYSPSTCRWATYAEQSQNRRKRAGSSSRFLGVTLDGRQFLARIKIAGKDTKLGRFATEDDAARAYDAAAREIYGPEARVNFPAAQATSA